VAQELGVLAADFRDGSIGRWWPRAASPRPPLRLRKNSATFRASGHDAHGYGAKGYRAGLLGLRSFTTTRQKGTA
jgi:hypothetical protein